MIRMISLHSKRKLKPADAKIFAGSASSLFAELAAVVCSTRMLPQKELHECWQMATLVHREFAGCLRIADIAAGHGLLAWIFVLLARQDEARVPRTAVAIDTSRPKSADVLSRAMVEHWPELEGTVHYIEGSVDAVTAEQDSGTLFVAAHACGGLSDKVLLAAIASRCPVAIMPCCHSLRKQAQSLAALAAASDLPPDAAKRIAASTVADGPAAMVDHFRIEVLSALGYEVCESRVQSEITPFNRIIMAKPPLVPHPIALAPRPVSPSGRYMRRRGEFRAHETVHELDVNNAAAAQALSMRATRAWLRSFDLSYWVEDEAMGRQLAHVIERLCGRFLLSGSLGIPQADNTAVTHSVTICDQYLEPLAKRRSYTYRIECKSSALELSKADGSALRRKICRGLRFLAHIQMAKYSLR